jgi:DNA replication protein DnaC
MSAATSSDVVSAQIENLAAELRLPTVRTMHRRLADEESQHGGDYLSFLKVLLQEEVDQRHVRRVQRRIKEARFPQLKLLGELDFSAEAMPPKPQIMSLATNQYVADGRNVICLGSPGTGKTHVATGLAVEACQAGMRTRFYPVATLAAELEAARDEHLLHRYLKRFGSWDLIVLDEVGYLPLSRTGAELLFQAISERHERRSLIITTNLPFGEWTEVFHTERLTAALLDRVTHGATILSMNGPSYRLRGSLAAANKQRDGDQ